MSVPEQIPYVGYIANGQTTEFPITFDLHDPEFLVVTLNKEIPIVGAYTIDMNAKKVVFATAPNDNDQVELYRETELNRDIDYKSYDNSFRPEVVNYDLDTVMRILQEQNMIDAEIAARIKGEIEWRRTHDANFDELSKMRDAQIFSGLKQYLDTILAMTNPNIFDGITAGIVFALDKKSVQTHIELIYAQLSENRLSIIAEKNRAIASETDLQTQIYSIASGASKGYKTYAAMEADKDNILANSIVKVTNDPDSTKNGDYQFNGSVFTKSIYDPLTQMKNLVGDSTPNLYNGTFLKLDFINNTLIGGGGIITYGTLFIDGIPENQSIILEENEDFPFGLRKICISKTSKLLKIFNSTELVSNDHILLGCLYGRKWYSIASGNKPTVIAENSSYEGYVSNLNYAGDAEIIGGGLVLNKEEKTISGSCSINSPVFRNVTAVNLTYSGNLKAIVLDVNDGLIKTLTDDEVISPSYILIANVIDSFIFTNSVNSAFIQEGSEKFQILGKVSSGDLTSEPAFLSDDLKLTVNFQSGVLTVNQNGYVFFDGTFASLNDTSGSSFDAVNPTYLRFVVLSKSANKIEIKESLSNTYSRSSILIGYIFNYSFYGFGDAKNRVTIVNSAGQIVENPDQYSFDELKQRALIPNKLFFINDRSLPLYKDSIFSNPKVGLEKVRTWIDTNNTDTLKRYIPVQQQTILNPTDLSNTAQFVYAHASVANKRYWKNVAVNKAAQSKLSRSFNMLCFGDSLTQVGTPWTLKNKLESLGATVTPVGTFWSTETPNELPSEGRGYWNYREFIGKDNNSSGTPHTRSEGGKTRTTKFETPFLKLATSQDKTDHPTWCFRFTGAQKELSYADDPVKTGNFYIFDFDWYLTQHSVANPDFITIGLSTNDINLDRDVYSRAEVMQFMQLGLEIMVKQIHKVLPNVPIGVIPCPAWSATENGYSTFAADTANWVELCIKKVAELKATHSNLEVIPVHLHMNRDMGYPLTAGSALTADSDVNVSVVSDWVHYDQIGRDQYVEVVAAWLANSI